MHLEWNFLEKIACGPLNAIFCKRDYLLHLCAINSIVYSEIISARFLWISEGEKKSCS